jgi:hypothetical protein
MKNKYSPIALFVYNRIQHTTQTIEALRSNDLASESDLFIFSDAPKAASENEAVHTVREYVYKVDGFKSVTIIERPVNLGLANSIIDGVTSIVNKHGRVIVMEDDLVTSPLFLKYMNDALSFYESNKEVASIHGYVYPIEGLPETFFLRGADCWGWATWSDRWKVFEPDGKKLLANLTSQGLIKRFDLNGAYAFSTMLKDQIKGLNNSWAIRWHASAFLNSQYTLYPGKSLVENIGNDGSGTHCASTNIFSTTLSNTEIRSLPTAVKEDEFVLELIESYFRSQKLTANIFIKLFTLLKRKIKS